MCTLRLCGESGFLVFRLRLCRTRQSTILFFREASDKPRVFQFLAEAKIQQVFSIERHLGLMHLLQDPVSINPVGRKRGTAPALS